MEMRKTSAWGAALHCLCLDWSHRPLPARGLTMAVAPGTRFDPYEIAGEYTGGIDAMPLRGHP